MCPDINSLFDAHNQREEPARISTPDSMESIESEELPAFFTERNGRRYHVQSNSTYPLPCDDREQQRLNAQHILLKQILQTNYIGQIGQILNAPGQSHGSARPKIVLDLCTGTGIWLTETATDFPRVHCIGVDMVPIATRYPENNVRFEVHNLLSGISCRDASVDIIHARDILLGFPSPRLPALIREIARVLIPGGLFASGEIHLSVHTPNGIDPFTYCPNTARFFQSLRQVLESLSHPSIGPAYLFNLLSTRNSAFEITQRNFYTIPLGGFSSDPQIREVGMRWANLMHDFALSIREIMDRAIGRESWDNIIRGFNEDITSRREMVMHYHTLSAIKR
ncbi:S-adenosyl-L-methionine-dependent methyltransferase [Sistotremastrum niveocremeum HHB9708]|uniref:S-adenosyl-L-methionine-dependent methyltransferase n=1 Tax=Sistotremastrum niveocremeum HHB9708 TaxID=1314777 RepID=A0A164MXT3_9AGAM|nr:S-adenosyl-L-methionine-dependent methyltransferase [Sistotremastrum niveocremeum HHB9708]